jgi:hypothetical protein
MEELIDWNKRVFWILSLFFVLREREREREMRERERVSLYNKEREG